MRVLVVDGYPATPEGKVAFKTFYNLVIASFKTTKNLDVDGINVSVRHHTKLDPYLYDHEAKFIDPMAVTRFDRLDFIFASADERLLPWSSSGTKLAILVKMCVKTNKCLFAANGVARTLAFVCNTNGFVSMTAINKCADNLARLKSFATLSNDEKSDVYLDSESGDYYVLNRVKKAWIPTGNCGIHSRDGNKIKGPMGARANGNLRRGVANKAVHDPLCVGKLGELRCRVRVEQMQHWILSDIIKKSRPEFMVKSSFRWDLDEGTNKSASQKFTTLADGDYGPLLMECGNCIGANFTVSANYPDTLVLLQRYGQVKYKLTLEFEHIDESSSSLLRSAVSLNQGHPAPAQRRSPVPCSAEHLHQNSYSSRMEAAEQVLLPEGDSRAPIASSGPGGKPRPKSAVLFNGSSSSSSSSHSSRKELKRRPGSAHPVLSQSRSRSRGRGNVSSHEKGQTGAGGSRTRPQSAFPTVPENSAVGAVGVGGKTAHFDTRPASAPVYRDLKNSSQKAGSAFQTNGNGKGKGKGAMKGDTRPMSARDYLLSKFDEESNTSNNNSRRCHSASSHSSSRSRPSSARQILERAAEDLVRKLDQTHMDKHGCGLPELAEEDEEEEEEEEMDGEEYERRMNQEGSDSDSDSEQEQEQDACKENDRGNSNKAEKEFFKSHRHSHSHSSRSRSSQKSAVQRQQSQQSKPHSQQHKPRAATTAPTAAAAAVPSNERDDDNSDNDSTDSSGSSSHSTRRTAPLRVKRCDVSRKPHCNFKKFDRMAKHTASQPGAGYYSVRNDGPYLSQYERDMREYHMGKNKWVAGADQPFCSTFGKRTRNLRDESDSTRVPINSNAGPWEPQVLEFHKKKPVKGMPGWGM